MPVLRGEITTIEQLLAVPTDGVRHELLDGVHVVTPAPAWNHQRIVRELMLILGGALRKCDELEVLSSPADIVLGPKALVQPDLFVVQTPASTAAPEWSDAGVPLLAIEILSPSTAWRDRGAKRRIYQRAGVGEYWIVDLDAHVVERWTPHDDRPEVIDGVLQWRPRDELIVDIPLPELFETLLPGP